MYTDSQGNIYTPSGLFVTAVPTLTGNQTKVLVPGPGGRISVVDISQLVSSTNGTGSSSAAGVRSFNGRTGDVLPENSDYLSDNIKEGQNNRYFTSDRARAAITLTTYGTTGTATYNPITGVINVPQYTVPAETDPIFTASIAAGITNINISNWNSAYGWGNHASAGYVPGTRTITINGTALDLSADRSWTIASYTLPTATASVLGGVKIGNGISISNGVISNYIYDTRNTRGATRLYRREDNSDYSVQTYWTGAYWRLYGYNGDTAHADVQVGYADSSGSVAWSNVSGRPSNISSFTNDAGYITSASNVVGLYGSGYGNGNFTWNQTPNAFAGYSGWASYMINNHGDGSNYYNQTIIMPFWSSPQYSRRENNVLKGPYGFITDENIGSQSVNYASSAGNASSVGGYGAGTFVFKSGDTMSGRLTIDSRNATNIPLHVIGVEPYIQIQAVGSSNTAGLAIYPTAGYDAAIGNFNGGSLNLMAASARVVQVTNSSGVIFYVGSHGPITAYGTNTSAYNIFINSSSSDKTWDISMYYNDWILNESNVASRLKVLAGGGVYADAFYEFSDKRFKTLIEENPTITNIDTITAKLYVKEGKQELGYYAQDFEGVLDSALLKDKDGILSLSYRQVHTAKIAALEKRVAELETKLNETK